MEENKLSQEEQKATIMINDLYKSYGDKDVLTGLNLEVYEKSYLVLLVEMVLENQQQLIV